MAPERESLREDVCSTRGQHETQWMGRGVRFADPNSTDTDGVPAAYYALQHPTANALELLLRHERGKPSPVRALLFHPEEAQGVFFQAGWVDGEPRYVGASSEGCPQLALPRTNSRREETRV